MSDRDAPIGVFDSGVGGLTVLRSLRIALPDEHFVYLGDTARVPYGTKSPETVAEYSVNVARLLLERGCKAIVIACNTASAFGVAAVRAISPGPVIDVIDPVAAQVSELSAGRVGVLGTRGTVASGAYARALEAGRVPHIVQRACPLLVPLAEEGWLDGDVPRLVVERYLEGLFREERLDSLILGCTHYPLLEGEIRAAAARHSPTAVAIYESGPAAAECLVRELEARELSNAGSAGGGVHYMVTDDPDGFRAVGRRFLGESVGAAEHVHVR